MLRRSDAGRRPRFAGGGVGGGGLSPWRRTGEGGRGTPVRSLLVVTGGQRRRCPSGPAAAVDAGAGVAGLSCRRRRSQISQKIHGIRRRRRRSGARSGRGLRRMQQQQRRSRRGGGGEELAVYRRSSRLAEIGEIGADGVAAFAPALQFRVSAGGSVDTMIGGRLKARCYYTYHALSLVVFKLN